MNETITCECGGQYFWSKYCGAYVCQQCGNHKGLVRCFCGWKCQIGIHEEPFDDVEDSYYL